LLIFEGAPRQHFLANHRLADYILKEMHHLPRSGQTAQITINQLG
jgi:hypothetical protein